MNPNGLQSAVNTKGEGGGGLERLGGFEGDGEMKDGFQFSPIKD